MGYHILIIPGLRPNYKFKTHGSFVQDHANALREYGHKVGFIHLGLRSVKTLSDGHLSEYLFNGIVDKSNKNHNELEIKRLNVGGIPSYINNRYNHLLNKLYKAYESKFGKPDLIHAHFTIWPGVGARYLSAKYNIPYCITEHSTIYSRGLIKSKYIPFIHKSLDDASYIICVSKGLGHDVKKYTTNKNLQIIGNPIDVSFFKPENKRSKKNNFSIFSLGYLTHKKGFDTLIRGFGELKKTNKLPDEVNLFIGGDGPEKNKLTTIINEYNINDRVKLLGELTRNEVKEWLSKSDIFALTSRHETFGVVFLEALAMGIPAIATRTAGPINFINTKNGYLIDIDDVDGLKSSIIDAYNKRKSWHNLSKTIRESVVDKFSMQKFAENTTLIYNRILDVNKRKTV